MFDLKLQSTCQHTIFDEVATIQGLSPNYFSILSVQSDGSSNFVTIREFSITEGMSDFKYSRDGFTNWSLSSDGRQINWNRVTAKNGGSSLGGPGTGIAAFLDGTTFIEPSPTMLVSYRANADLCPRCIKPLHLTKDIDFDPRGGLQTLTGTSKVKQQIFKALLTELGTNTVAPSYGSSISGNIGQKFDSFAEYQIYSSVMQAVQFLVDQQITQPLLPLDETILGVQSIGVVQDATDPRIIRIMINVKVATLDVVDVNFSMLT